MLENSMLKEICRPKTDEVIRHFTVLFNVELIILCSHGCKTVKNLSDTITNVISLA
jgi:hypothetical protein